MSKTISTHAPRRRSRALKTDPAAPLYDADRRFPPAVQIIARQGRISIHHAAALAAIWGLPVDGHLLAREFGR